MKDIRRILREAEIGVVRFDHSYQSAQGKQLNCFMLPKREFNLVISGYSVKHRLALIDRLEELEAKAVNPALTETQEALGKVLALFEEREVVMVLAAFAPTNTYESGMGIRRGCYVNCKSRIPEADRLWAQRVAINELQDAVSGQLRLAI
jgi:hypothetical protein